MIECEEALEKTNLPQYIQNTILHMLAFDEVNRITTYSLFEYLFQKIFELRRTVSEIEALSMRSAYLAVFGARCSCLPICAIVLMGAASGSS